MIAYQVFSGNSASIHWEMISTTFLALTVCGDSIILLAYDTRWKASLHDIMLNIKHIFQQKTFDHHLAIPFSKNLALPIEIPILYFLLPAQHEFHYHQFVRPPGQYLVGSKHHYQYRNTGLSLSKARCSPWFLEMCLVTVGQTLWLYGQQGHLKVGEIFQYLKVGEIG